MHDVMLVFGRTPQKVLPSSEIKCAHFHGTEVAKPIPSYQVYKSAVFNLVDQAVDFVKSKLALRAGTRASGPKAPVAYEVLREVVTEGIVNAVAHRGYASNGNVQVMLFSDRLEIWNPCRLPDSLPLARLREPRGLLPHDPLIAEPMYLTRYIERLGTGVGDMIRRCREAGLSETSYNAIQGDRPNPAHYLARRPLQGGFDSGRNFGETFGQNLDEKSGENGPRVVALILEQPDIEISEIVERLGRTVRAGEMQIQHLRYAKIMGVSGWQRGPLGSPQSGRKHRYEVG